jgi:glutamate/tyrosine decarboxylase-like PLP-dependent enzyme
MVELPKRGRSRREVIDLLREAMKDDAPWDQGRTFYLVYGVDDDHLELLREAYSLFMATNGLGAGSIFPSVGRLEAEVIEMAARLLGGGDRAVGNITSGGTESILMGVWAARQRSRRERPQITRPEIVLPASAHPAFQKAAELYGIRTVRTPLDARYVADVPALARAVTDNTIAIVGSAPNYTFGTIDPIEELAAIARDRGIHFHVDGCVGGFALPFLRRLGQPVPPFDLSVPGVTTLSADIHKYAFGARGTSVILYRDAEVRDTARFVLDEWSGGPYRTATMAGSRPGGMVAAAWAVLTYFGEDGYLQRTRETLETTRALRTGIERIPGFRILGDPAMYLFAFASDRHDVMAVADAMAERCWHLGRQPTDPPSLHVVLTPVHTRIVGSFLKDLEDVAATVARAGGRRPAAGPSYAAH